MVRSAGRQLPPNPTPNQTGVSPERTTRVQLLAGISPKTHAFAEQPVRSRVPLPGSALGHGPRHPLAPSPSPAAVSPGPRIPRIPSAPSLQPHLSALLQAHLSRGPPPLGASGITPDSTGRAPRPAPGSHPHQGSHRLPPQASRSKRGSHAFCLPLPLPPHLVMASVLPPTPAWPAHSAPRP